MTTPTGTATAVTNANSGGVTEVMVKKLYLEGKFDKAFVVHVGAYTSPWAPFVESLYGYRFVEKTATDRLGFAQTADWGLNATGAALDNGMLTYSASVVNGGGYKNPTRTKKVDFEGRIGLKPIDWLTIGAGYYNGHLGQVTATNDSFPQNTAQRYDFVIGANWQGLRVGGEYFNAKNYKTVNNAATAAYGTSSVVGSSATTVPVSDKAAGFSGWASYSFNDQWSVFGRYDDVKLSKDVARDLKDQYANVGVDFKPIKPLDVALVYKYEKVQNGSSSISGGNANGSFTIGGANASTEGKYNEVGVFMQYQF
ncbi:MAG TPA: hypothetical protein VJQ47_10270 [Steroidobacteraceae bacterium]|nr:hypothetical protein [Steroidobacteraceae bacterium]